MKAEPHAAIIDRGDLQEPVSGDAATLRCDCGCYVGLAIDLNITDAARLRWAINGAPASRRQPEVDWRTERPVSTTSSDKYRTIDRLQGRGDPPLELTDRMATVITLPPGRSRGLSQSASGRAALVGALEQREGRRRD